ncbi:hypothetical protein GHT06_011043 [Daphnia sinensis]|uniref:Uncharacterized protein n=1 Tax=Daphnia sinensis TaxID=1820382 RepID=A0AAD5Q100_9CRUS|nr:hypothetical protein GHT06_011043 [Daphnia sinensis]
MIKLTILLVCLVLAYAKPQRPGFYIPAEYSQYEGVHPYYVRVMQPLLRPASGFPTMTANTAPNPSYPTVVRLPSLPNRRQFRLPVGAYYLLPANAVRSRHDLPINAAHKLFHPMSLPLAVGPQARPSIVAAEDDGECQDDSPAISPSKDVE